VPIFYPDILNERTPPRRFTYCDRDAILYALGIGMGGDPLDAHQLRFVYEKDLSVVPTAATVLTKVNSGADLGDIEPVPGLRRSGMTLEKILHGEQKVVLHRPLARADSLFFVDRFVGAFDKGPNIGAVVVKEATWRDQRGEEVATLTSTLFARGDGGFGGPRDGQPRPHAVPGRKPDISVDLATSTGQALLYRLSGDRNPLHADPESARRSGFARPILHGLCTYGITCRAVLQSIVNFDADAIYSHEARFTAPVYPGETITIDLWVDGRDISFEARVAARGVTVIKNGLTVLRG